MLLRVLLALVLGVPASAAAPPGVELSASPAWKGWTRPGQATEIDIRVRSERALPATLEVAAGTHRAGTAIEVQAERPARLQLPVFGSEPRVTVALRGPAGVEVSREVALAVSESPLLGVAVAGDAAVSVQGLRSVMLGAPDLPRHAIAYSSIDALIVDATTLADLDPAQLGALLAHAARCGRIVLVDVDAQVRSLVRGSGACGDEWPMHAASLAEARDSLESWLSRSAPAPLPVSTAAELAGPDLSVWSRAAVALAACFAACVLALLFVPTGAVIVLVPLLAAASVVALLSGLRTPARLVVWSEAVTGAKSARYQAWQAAQGAWRETVRVPIPQLLAEGARPCAAQPAMRLHFDAVQARPTHAEFETRLFRPVVLCYEGSFPIARSPELRAQPGGTFELRNAGMNAWPPGVLVLGGRSQGLPALAPGAQAAVDPRTGTPPVEPVVRLAARRAGVDAGAALWALDLGAVSEVPVRAQGWLFVSVDVP